MDWLRLIPTSGWDRKRATRYAMTTDRNLSATATD